MKKFAIVVFREDGTKFIRSFHSSLVIARRIADDLNTCPFLSLCHYKVFDLIHRCFC